MWKEDDEEKYNDMNIVEKLTIGKRGVMGDFPCILVKEKTMRFEYIKLFDDKFGIFLPEKEGEISHIEKNLFYPTEMGEYIEYVSEDDNYYFTVEYFENKDNLNLEILSEHMCDDINDRYEYTKVRKVGRYIYNNMEIEVLFATTSSEESVYAGIFIIKKINKIYRLYISSKKQNYEAMILMSYKIIKNISVDE